MKRAALIISTAALATGLLSVAALAQGRMHGGPGFGQISFEQLDADKSGEISRDEMQNIARQRFDLTDANADGLLSKAEIAEHIRQGAEDRAARMVGHMDADGDGSIGFDEMNGRRDPGRMFSRMDADDNGGISESEFNEARERMQAHMKNRRNKN